MMDTPAVLVLVGNVDQREAVRQRLIALNVLPISVRADRAAEAVSLYRPIAALIDEAHAATAPDDFLETTCTHHVRLATLPDLEFIDGASDAALQYAVRSAV